VIFINKKSFMGNEGWLIAAYAIFIAYEAG
jgi:hypothetical protein